MRPLGRKILTNELSEYVRLAANGETVPAIDRGKAAAEPCDSKAPSPTAQRLENCRAIRFHARHQPHIPKPPSTRKRLP
jgi:hypothetical protein